MTDLGSITRGPGSDYDWQQHMRTMPWACPMCGAAVIDIKLHGEWHADLLAANARRDPS